MIPIKYRQRNKNNKTYHYWGCSLDVTQKGGWVPPRLQDNYVDLDESDHFTGAYDIYEEEIYSNDSLHYTDINLARTDIVPLYVYWDSNCCGYKLKTLKGRIYPIEVANYCSLQQKGEK